MGRRIWLNIIRRSFWTIQRVLLFVVLFAFFAMAFFMSDIASRVSQESLSSVDLNVSVGSYLQQSSYYALFSESFLDYQESVNEYIDIYNELNQHPGIAYAGMDVETGVQGTFFVKEKDRMGTSSIVNDPAKNVRSEISFAKISNQLPNTMIMLVDYHNRFEQRKDEDVQIETIPIEEQSDFQILENSHYGTFVYGTSNPVPQRMRFGIEKLTDGRSFAPEEIETGDMVCYIPENLVWFDRSLADDGYKIYEIGDDITLSAYLFDENGNLSGSLDYTFRIIGKYKTTTSGSDSVPSFQLYIPQKTLVRMHDEAYGYYTENGRRYFEFVKAIDVYSPTAMTFTLNSVDDLNSFIETIESLPQYQSGELMYYAAVSDVAEVYSGLMSFADSFSSIMYVFAVLVVIIAAMMAVLDAFYRRREIALLQSLGESPSSVTLQFVVENFILMAVSNAIAIPLALIFSRSAVPRLISSVPSIGKTAGQLPGAEYAKVPEIDISAIVDSIAVSTQQVLLSIVLIAIALAACAVATSLFAKRFSSRRFLNDR